MKDIIKWQILVVVFVLIFCQGCADLPRLDSEETIVPPKNNMIPLQGTWQIEDFRSISGGNYMDEGSEDWIGEKAIFTETFAILGNEQCLKAEYKIRTVNSREYFLFHYGVDPEELEVSGIKTNIISVSSQDKPFYDFIKAGEDRLMVYAYGGFYILSKLSDDVDNSYIANNIRIEEKDRLEGEEQELLRSGVLLGLRSVSHIPGDDKGDGLRYSYRTLWIASYNREMHPILEVSDLFVPRRSGFWRIGIKTQKIGEYLQDYLFTYPVEQEFHSLIPEADKAILQQGNIAKSIMFVGDDYIALEYSYLEDSDSINKRYRVLPLDDVNNAKGIRVSDIAGKGMEDTFYKSAEAHLISRGLRIPGKLKDIAREDNFTLVRRNGHWILQGRLNYNNNQEDFTIGISPVSKLVNYDDLHVPWNMIKEIAPAAVDAYTSPNKDILLVVTSSFIDIYAIKDGQIINNNPLRRVNIRNGETVIMAEWATGEYVARWEKSVSQLNPFVIGD